MCQLGKFHIVSSSSVNDQCKCGPSLNISTATPMESCYLYPTGDFSGGYCPGMNCTWTVHIGYNLYQPKFDDTFLEIDIFLDAFSFASDFLKITNCNSNTSLNIVSNSSSENPVMIAAPTQEREICVYFDSQPSDLCTEYFCQWNMNFCEFSTPSSSEGYYIEVSFLQAFIHALIQHYQLTETLKNVKKVKGLRGAPKTFYSL